ncbi:hypothetical protein AZE42_11814 [Rhizopogon vesiculosus]|uniref:Uncharacterized protein n=1 Tax=Rhizopogon vesiculosus TaxID=180088 RepID=A0A1J8R5I5_9AGAM|nr:hypothetical protein AZE42_11814 [Rhizopogon vesiculosus]
MLPNHQEWYL